MAKRVGHGFGRAGGEVAGLPVVVLDFDRTVFDSDRFYDDVLDLLAERHSADPQQLRGEYPDYCQWQGAVRYYDLFRHVRAHGLDDVAVERLIGRELAGRTYVYDDVAPFLLFVMPAASTVGIVTHGLARYQEVKRRLAPQIEKLPFHALLEEKAGFIAASYPQRRGLIIDDKPVPGLPAGFRHVWIDRVGQAGPDRYPSLQAIMEDWQHVIAETPN